MVNSSFKIIRASSQNLELSLQAIEKLHHRKPIEAEAINDFLRDPLCYLLLAVENDIVIGSLNGYSLPHPNQRQPQFLLYEIDVKPDWQGKGVGQALVNQFTAEAQVANAFEIWVLSNESNLAAIRMYQKCGFQRRHSDDVMLSLSIK